MPVALGDRCPTSFVSVRRGLLAILGEEGDPEPACEHQNDS